MCFASWIMSIYEYYAFHWISCERYHKHDRHLTIRISLKVTLMDKFQNFFLLSMLKSKTCVLNDKSWIISIYEYYVFYGISCERYHEHDRHFTTLISLKDTVMDDDLMNFIQDVIISVLERDSIKIVATLSLFNVDTKIKW